MTYRTSNFLERPIAAILAILLAAQVAQAAPQQVVQEPAQPAPTQQPSVPAPDAPAPQLLDPSARSSATQSEQQGGQNPVGTAAAPVTRPTGVAASRPAGAAIAPAKQHRAKIILISIGVIVAAGAAIGAVAGLSRSSSARP